MGMTAPVGYLYWYTTSIILVILTLINISSHIAHRLFKRPCVKSPDPLPASLPALRNSPSDQTAISDLRAEEAGTPQSDSSDGKFGIIRRLGRAGATGWNRYAILTAVRIPTLSIPRKGKRVVKSFMPTTELIWTVAYLVGCLILFFYETAWDVKAYANQSGWLCCAQMPLIIALAGKNNLVSFLTGIGYEKLAFLHIAAGRVCFLGMWIHAGGYFFLLEGFDSENWATQLSRWGFTGLLAFTLLTVTSLRWVRRKLYEFFLVVHLCLVALTLAAFIMHWRAVDIWIYPGIALWAGDRLFRILRIVLLNKLWLALPSVKTPAIPSTATLKLLTPSTLMISFQNPASYLHWTAGQHFYVVIPGLSRLPWEAHPFTCAIIPAHSDMGLGAGQVTFIVRVRDGATKRIKDEVDKQRKAVGLGIDEEFSIDVPAAVEGPYGEARKMDMYDGVVIVAGGSGISFAVAHMLQAIRDAKDGKPHPRQFKIIWMVKSRLHLNWISPILFAQAHSIPSTLQVSLHIHVTRHYIPRAAFAPAAQSELPTDPAATADNSWSTYLAERAAEPPRRRSRLMSTMSWVTFASDPDVDSRSGPGTRRGSTYVLNSDTAKLGPAASSATAKEVPPTAEALEKQYREEQDARVALANFQWSEGYNTGDVEKGRFGGFTTKKRSFEALSFEAVEEKDELDATSTSPYLPYDGTLGIAPSQISMSPSGSPALPSMDNNDDIPDDASWKLSPPSSPNHRATRRLGSLPAGPPSPVQFPRRASLAPSADSPKSSRRGSILLDHRASFSRDRDPLSGTPSPPSSSSLMKRPSVSFDEPVLPPGSRRRSSVSIESTGNPMLSRRSSMLSPTATPIFAPSPRRPSALLNVMTINDTVSPVEEKDDELDRALAAMPISSLNPPPARGTSPGNQHLLRTPPASFSARTRPSLSPLYIGPSGSAMSPPPFSPSPFSSEFTLAPGSNPNPNARFGNRSASMSQPRTDPGPLLMAPMMVKSSSNHSGLSVRSIDSDSNAPSPIPFLHLNRRSGPIGLLGRAPDSPSSGIRTPALTAMHNQPTTVTTNPLDQIPLSKVTTDSNGNATIVQDPKQTTAAAADQEAPVAESQALDLSKPANLDNPEALLEHAFKSTERERQNLSQGMESLVFWHEGRADIHAVVLEMTQSLGRGCTVDVEACGPKSLLEKCKEVVRDLGDVKEVWRGGPRVTYHAETFGW